MKKLNFILLFLLALPLAAAAFDRSELAEFNELYKNERYEEAFDGYSKMIAKEPGNPRGWYNAGNAMFRLNRRGEAVYYYAKAFNLDPRDGDMRFNLEFALRQTGQNLLPDGVPRALHIVYYLFSDKELLTLVIFFFWLGCLTGAAGFLLDGSGWGLRCTRTAVMAGLLCAVSGAWLGARQSSPFTHAGVVTKAEGARLLSGPGENFKASASVPEGMLVKIMDEMDDNYYEIGLTKEGIKGWALKTDVRKI